MSKKILSVLSGALLLSLIAVSVLLSQARNASALLSAEVESLTAGVEAKNAQIESLTADAEAKSAAIDSLTADAEVKDAAIDSLTADVEARDAAIDSLTADAEVKDAAIESLTADIEARDAAIVSLTADVEAKNAQIESLTADVEAKSAAIDSLTADTEAKSAAIDSLTADAEAKSAAIDSLTADVEARDAAIDSLTADAEAKSAAIDSLTADVEARDAAIDSLTADLEYREAEVAGLSAALADLRSLPEADEEEAFDATRYFLQACEEAGIPCRYSGADGDGNDLITVAQGGLIPYTARVWFSADSRRVPFLIWHYIQFSAIDRPELIELCNQLNKQSADVTYLVDDWDNSISVRGVMAFSEREDGARADFAAFRELLERLHANEELFLPYSQ